MIELRMASRDHDRLRVCAWLSAPHVVRWWGDAADRMRQFDSTPDGEHAVIVKDGEPIGYMRWQTVIIEELQSVGLDEIPEGSIDCDLFIGDEGLTGQGIGPQVVELLIEHLRDTTQAPLVGFCTSVDNKPAHAAFRKAGCNNLTTFDAPAYGPCHVFVRWLR